MPNPIWTVSASLEVRKVSIYGINSKRNCKKKEKWTQMRMPNRTECRYFFLSLQEFTVGTKPHIPAEPSPGFPSILQNPLLLPLFSKGGPSAGKPRKSSQSPRRKGVVHSDQDWLGTTLPAGICFHTARPRCGDTVGPFPDYSCWTVSSGCLQGTGLNTRHLYGDSCSDRYTK